jgi:hypothetical protein
MTGAKAIKLRRDPDPRAPTASSTGSSGMDPDQDAHADRAGRRSGGLFHGDYHSSSLVEDALLLALVETGVPVYAVDEATLHGPLGRAARAGRRAARRRTARPRPAAGAPGRGRRPAARRGAVRRRSGTQPGRAGQPPPALMAVGVEGVPRIHVEEALFACAEALQSR